mgnify:CR=1 FL=1
MDNKQYAYQAMFLLDNEEVRAQGFNATRDWVRTTLEKHGADVKVLRLWAEQALAYPIAGRKRATYLMGWVMAGQETVSAVKREMYLLGPVFRILFLREDEIPEDELGVGIEDADVDVPEEIEEEYVEEYITGSDKPKKPEKDSEESDEGDKKGEEAEEPTSEKTPEPAVAASNEKDQG